MFAEFVLYAKNSAARKMSHLNIGIVFELGSQGGVVPAIELAAGHSLNEKLKAGLRHETEVLRFAQPAEGLAAAPCAAISSSGN